MLCCRGNRIHCTLWDDYAEQLKRFLESHDPKLPVVVLIQMCKLKKYFGAMGISNAFYGTNLLFDVEIPEVASYLEKYVVFTEPFFFFCITLFKLIDYYSFTTYIYI